MINRSSESLPLARAKLGLGTIVARGPFTLMDQVDARLRDLFQHLYGNESLNRRFGHGVVEFRGAPYLVKVPLVYGKVQIDPFEHTTLTRLQTDILSRDKFLFSGAIYQIGDAFDALIGLDSKLSQNPTSASSRRSPAKVLFSECIKNFLAACTLAAQSVDSSECFQSSFIAMELCVKGVLAERGYNQEQRRKLGHNTKLFLGALEDQKICVDYPKLRHALESVPDFVDARYGEVEIIEPVAVRFLFSVQFLIAELMRISLNQSFLDSLDSEIERPWPPTQR